MKRAAPLNIAIHHCSERQEKPLRFFFQSKTIGEYQLSSAEFADIHMIDIDNREGFAFAERMLAGPAANRVLCMSLGREAPYQGRCVNKPVHKEPLLLALREIKADITKQPCKEAPKYSPVPNMSKSNIANDDENKAAAIKGASKKQQALPASGDTEPSRKEPPCDAPRLVNSFSKTGTAKNTAQAAQKLRSPKSLARHANDDLDTLSQERYQSGNYLQGLVKDALDLSRENESPVKLSIAKEALIICAKENSVRHKIKYNTLRSIASSPLLKSSTSINTLKESEKGSQQYIFEESLSGFLWRCSAWAARGRLLDDVDLDQNLRLSRWPNLTRVLLFPHASKIAALLASRPISLSELIMDYKLPAYYVFSFYSAAASLGYITRYDGPKSSVEKPARGQGILLSLLNRLKPQSHKSEQI